MRAIIVLAFSAIVLTSLMSSGMLLAVLRVASFVASLASAVPR